MNSHYEKLLEHYYDLLKILENDKREVSKEMIQIVKDEIEDVMIELGRASQIQPNLFGCIGYKL